MPHHDNEIAVQSLRQVFLSLGVLLTESYPMHVVTLGDDHSESLCVLGAFYQIACGGALKVCVM